MINDLTINKLILLYILTRVNAPIDNSELIDFMIKNEYSDYFNIQQYMADLLKSRLVHKINQNRKSLYMITPDGSTALQYFTNRIPKDYVDVMDAFCSNIMNKYADFTLYNSKVSEYTKDKYQLECFITKNEIEILNIKIPELSKEKAKYISEHWKNNAKEIYECIKNKMDL
ncbi:MAG TPA: hypothetical protein DCP90_02670 [Clostridiales bacterium]|nr:MAG: hypothetical protein A2Y22_01580 [Clostridiales bacterium GWD2_32_59]HAN09496.1 hypothetical protein [Clostridiales bacterium]